MCILNLIFFKNLVCVFLFIPTPFIFPRNCFSHNLFCFSYFYRGRNFFLTFVVLRGSCCSSQGELSLFSLTLLHIFFVYFLIRQSLSIRDKKGETQITCLFCLGGEYKNFLMYLTQGESQNLLFFFYILFHIIVYMSFFPHMW